MHDPRARNEICYIQRLMSAVQEADRKEAVAG